MLLSELGTKVILTKSSKELSLRSLPRDPARSKAAHNGGSQCSPELVDEEMNCT